MQVLVASASPSQEGDTSGQAELPLTRAAKDVSRSAVGLGAAFGAGAGENISTFGGAKMTASDSALRRFGEGGGEKMTILRYKSAPSDTALRRCHPVSIQGAGGVPLHCGHRRD